MQTIYLDQNQWIALAQANKNPKSQPDLKTLLIRICEGICTDRIRIPLTFTNIYETQKINNPKRRSELAKMQAVLSRGIVFRGQSKRREVEVSQFITRILKLSNEPMDDDWFLSNLFFESVAERRDICEAANLSDAVLELIRSRPAEFLYDYLVKISNNIRQKAVQNFSDGSESLRVLIEDRRQRNSSETQAMRRRIYSATMMIDHCDTILGIAHELGAHWKEVSDIGSSNARRMMNEVPSFYIEREIAIRLESQSRPIEENDFRDMQAFCAVIPYADLVIGEKQFTNLARQANLAQQYNTRLETNILALNDFLDDQANQQSS